jgi:hypothetical protein
MVKKTKRHNRNRCQKGGFLGFFEEEKNDINGNVSTDSGMLSTITNLFTPTSTPSYSTPTPTPTSTPSYSTPTPTSTPSYSTPTSNSYLGGRRRSKHMRGGIGTSKGLGLTYYASPVDGIKVAEPTYMEYYKGGRRYNTRKYRKGKKCNKTCRKNHRHCRR